MDRYFLFGLISLSILSPALSSSGIREKPAWIASGGIPANTRMVLGGRTTIPVLRNTQSIMGQPIHLKQTYSLERKLLQPPRIDPSKRNLLFNENDMEIRCHIKLYKSLGKDDRLAGRRPEDERLILLIPSLIIWWRHRHPNEPYPLNHLNHRPQYGQNDVLDPECQRYFLNRGLKPSDLARRLADPIEEQEMPENLQKFLSQENEQQQQQGEAKSPAVVDPGVRIEDLWRRLDNLLCRPDEHKGALDKPVRIPSDIKSSSLWRLPLKPDQPAGNLEVTDNPFASTTEPYGWPNFMNRTSPITTIRQADELTSGVFRLTGIKAGEKGSSLDLAAAPVQKEPEVHQVNDTQSNEFMNIVSSIIKDIDQVYNSRGLKN